MACFVKLKKFSRGICSSLSRTILRKSCKRPSAVEETDATSDYCISEEENELDCDVSKLDIISELIDMHLEDIAGDILSNLNEIDIANAVTANPKWSAIATSRTRIKRLFLGNNSKSTPLKTLYRREELLARQKTDVRPLFQQACEKLSELDKASLEENEEDEADFLLDTSSQCPNDGFIKKIFFSSEFIAVVSDGLVPRAAKRKKKKRNIILLQVFNRWTFQLVNALTVKCRDVEDIIQISTDALLIPCCVEWTKFAIFLWDFTSGKVHVTPCSRLLLSFSIGKLVVLLFNGEHGTSATVYKADVESEKKIVCLMERESLNGFLRGRHVPSGEDLDYFGLCLNATLINTPHYSMFQLRSKEDFSLMRAVATQGRPPPHPNNAHLLSDCFVLAYNEETRCLEVNALVQYSQSRTVYQFNVPKKMYRLSPYAFLGGWMIKVIERRFLFLYGGRFYAAIWKLPSYFVEICHRHLKEGTVGVTSQCDQFIRERSTTSSSEVFYYPYEIDRYGIVRTCIDRETPSAVYVTMLNSIITDWED